MSVFDVPVIIFLLAGFCVVHSFLASEKAKKFAAKRLGEFNIFYRAIYNAVSVLLLAFVLYASPKPPVIIYDLPSPIDLIVFFLQALSLVGVVYAFKAMDLRELLGIEQISNYYGGIETETPIKFRHGKLHKYMRHPLYFFLILFAGFRPEMDVFYFTAFVCFSSYFYIGSFFEEKKLVKQFGDSYVEYQKSVPRIFPLKIIK
jgi:methanethiol S-methyltransferase